MRARLAASECQTSISYRLANEIRDDSGGDSDPHRRWRRTLHAALPRLRMTAARLGGEQKAQFNLGVQ